MHNQMAIFMITLLLSLSHAQVNHTVLPLQVQEVHIAPTISSIPSQHNFKVEFKGTGHDIHGAVYESD